MIIFALALATPIPFNDIHQQDIGCVAVLGIVAGEQRRGVAGSSTLPDVRLTGKRWAGLVGGRIMAETGQPRELVAFAITEAVKAEQSRASAGENPAFVVRTRLEECLPRMQAQLAEADAANAPLPKPVKAQ
jgi:hypothetical protein